MEKNLRPLGEEEEERAVGEEEPEEMEGAVGGVEHHDVETSSLLAQAGSNSNNSNSEAFSSDPESMMSFGTDNGGGGESIAQGVGIGINLGGNANQGRRRLMYGGFQGRQALQIWNTNWLLFAPPHPIVTTPIPATTIQPLPPVAPATLATAGVSSTSAFGADPAQSSSSQMVNDWLFSLLLGVIGMAIGPVLACLALVVFCFTSAFGIAVWPFLACIGCILALIGFILGFVIFCFTSAFGIAVWPLLTGVGVIVSVIIIGASIYKFVYFILWLLSFFMGLAGRFRRA